MLFRSGAAPLLGLRLVGDEGVEDLALALNLPLCLLLLLPVDLRARAEKAPQRRRPLRTGPSGSRM